MPEQSQQNEYLLGVNPAELERLRFQHRVWRDVTERLFDRVNVQRGWKCLDVGAGPGFVTMDLRERVGESGEVTALEPSPLYLDWLRGISEGKGWKNVHFTQGVAESAILPEAHFDFVFARWVIAFVPNPESFLIPLFSALRPGGVIALQDYYYEGLSLFPGGGAFDRMADVVRGYYRSGGGDPYVTGRIPAIFRKYGLLLIDYTPNCLAGGPDSAIMEWGHRFFTMHIQVMVGKGLISKQEGDAMISDWLTHRANPDAVFFSPIVVDVAARSLKPA